MHSLRQFLDKFSQCHIKIYIRAPPRTPVEERTRWNGNIEQLFEAKRLRTELNFVAAVALRFAAFVLDREWLASTKLDHVSLSDETQPQAAQRKPARNAHLATRLGARGMRRFVQQAAFGSQPVLFPLLFEMDQRPLPFAEHQMLKPGERQQVVFAVHRLRVPPGADAVERLRAVFRRMKVARVIAKCAR